MASTVEFLKHTSTQFVSGDTRVGMRILFVSVSEPVSVPQNQRLPSDCCATVCTGPAQTLIQFEPEPTCTATAVLLVEPIPNCPPQLTPQAHNVPSFFNATLYAAPPAAASFQSLPGSERTGVFRFVFVPSPN